jgi:large subunit ribosomal protein L24e
VDTHLLVRLEICSFSGHKIYPGHGKRFIRSDSRSFSLLSGKNESHFLSKKNPRKFNWTVVYRRLHKKGSSEEAIKKRQRKTVKHSRAIVGVSWEEIKARRSQPESVRAAQREKALKEGKEKKKEEQQKKKAEKVKVIEEFAID